MQKTTFWLWESNLDLKGYSKPIKRTICALIMKKKNISHSLLRLLHSPYFSVYCSPWLPIQQRRGEKLIICKCWLNLTRGCQDLHRIMEKNTFWNLWQPHPPNTLFLKSTISSFGEKVRNILLNTLLMCSLLPWVAWQSQRCSNRPNLEPSVQEAVIMSSASSEGRWRGGRVPWRAQCR